MDARHTVSIIVLALELSGAFLLAVELLWSVTQFVGYAKRTHRGLAIATRDTPFSCGASYDTCLTRHTITSCNCLQWTINVICFFAWCAVASPLVWLYTELVFSPIAQSIPFFGLILIMITWPFFSICLLYSFVPLLHFADKAQNIIHRLAFAPATGLRLVLASFLKFVHTGIPEKQLARIGFLLLIAGFAIQVVLNCTG